MRKYVATLALAFLVAHVAWLPFTFGDLDGINFALGVRHYDVSEHQPHPPGYPIYIALSKVSTAVLLSLGVPGAEVRGLAIWSAIGGAVLIVALFAWFRALDGSEWRAWWATLLTAAAPLVWFTALRPMSDIAGFAVATIAQVLLVRWLTGDAGRSHLIAGSSIAGVAIGFRSQTFLLTLPLLGLVLASPRANGALRRRALVSLAIGSLTWAVPLVFVSGGITPYLASLGSQGAEDFSGVVMLWNFPRLDVALLALRHSFISPWATVPLALAVLVPALVGCAAIARQPSTAFVLAAMVLPYAVFHLLFHEAVTVRYALPLVPVVAWLAVRGIERLSVRVLPYAVAGLAVAGLGFAVPAGAKYAASPAPIFRAMEAIAAERQATSVAIGSHRRVFTESKRVRRWLGAQGTWLTSPRDFEWLELTHGWRSGRIGAAWFLADPRRTDLALIDSAASRVVKYRWPFDGSVFVGGARPDEFDAHIYDRAPGWFLEEGWALTPEIAGISAREGWEPTRRPSVGWIRRRSEGAEMILGGRHLGTVEAPAARLVATIDGHTLLDAPVAPGAFVERVTVPRDALTGTGEFAQLLVQAVLPAGSQERLSLEQFDVQSPGVPMLAFGAGWHEPEYDPNSGQQWRWMSGRATLWVRPVGHDVTLTLRGESTQRYFKHPSVVRVSVGSTVVSEMSAGSDFTWDVRISEGLLKAHDGQVVVTSNQAFVPARRVGGDRRSLAVRVYSAAIRHGG